MTRGQAAGANMAADDRPVVRRAGVADAAALAGLHIKAWQWAYRGQLPAAYLDDLAASFDRRLEWRREMLSRPRPEDRTWVVETPGGIVGFADTGPSPADDALPGTAVLFTIYLDEAAAGRGIGRMLHTHALEDLRQRGYSSATLWVLASNARARRFYEMAGWRPDGAMRTEDIPGMELSEVRYRIDLSHDSGSGA